jgi:transposase
MVHTIGSSFDTEVVQNLVLQGERWINEKKGLVELDFSGQRSSIFQVLERIEKWEVQGTEMLLGKIFDEIGFDKIGDKIFRKLVIGRLVYAASKLKTVDLLAQYNDYYLDVQSVYRYMDKLYNSQKELVQQISYEHTVKVLNQRPSIVFYDVTTLYFEVDQEDSLRKTGFSKEGRHQNPQIVLGLLVSLDGYPLAYEIFEGNKFEGHTMLPVVETFKNKYSLDKLVIIADSGLLSNANVEALQKEGYEYILGARIKSEKQPTRDLITKLGLGNGECQWVDNGPLRKLLVSYSEARAKKDKLNREKGLKKLQKQILSGKLTKANINNKGYNKYLRMEGSIQISIDLEKFKADGQWDGLKGYITNTNLSKEEIIESYGQLWKIEKAFRISKSDLKIRPIFHYRQRRIEAHICITFAAYKVYKELERQLKSLGSKLSPEKAIEIAKTVIAIHLTIPSTNEPVKKLLLLNDKQKSLFSLFNLTQI